MPYPANRLKLVPYGTINAVQDWSTTLQCAAVLTAGALTQTQLVVATSGLATPFHTWAQALAGYWSPSLSCIGLRAYWYDAAGDHAALLADSPFGTAVPGTGTAPLPSLLSVVASLRTSQPGRSYRGRSYMPMLSGGFQANNQLSNSDCVIISSAYHALIQSVNSFTSSSGNITSLTACVASAVKSVMTPITLIRVDSLPDTQHRREDKLAAATFAQDTIT